MLEVIMFVIAIALIPVVLQVMLGLGMVVAWTIGLPFRLFNWATKTEVSNGVASLVYFVALLTFYAIFG